MRYSIQGLRLKRPHWSVILLLISFQFFLSDFLLAQTVLTRQIGNTIGLSSWNYGPVYRNTNNAGLINYSRHAYIYTAAELNIPAGSKIVSIEWLKKDTGRVLGNNVFNIWLANSSSSGFASTESWSNLTSGASQVFGSTTYSIAGGANSYIMAGFNQPSPNDSFTYSGGSLKILTDWNKTGFATSSIQFYYSSAAGKCVSSVSSTPFTSSTVLSSGAFGDNRPTIRITYVTVPNCSGTPTPGATISSSALVCPAALFTLSLQNSTPGNQVNFEWQSATNSSFTSGFSGTLGNTSSLTTSQTGAKYYRCKVTCAATSQVAYSTPLMVGMSPNYNCTCVSSAVAGSDEDIIKVTIGNYHNCSDCFATAPGPGSSQGIYSNFKTLAAHPVGEKGKQVPFTIMVGVCNPSQYSNRTAIFIDFNQNGTFSDSGEQVYSSPVVFTGPHSESGFINIPTTAAGGLIALRIITAEQNSAITNPCLVYNWGETEDYLINIINSTSCTGSPNPGATLLDMPGSCSVLSGSQSICAGNQASLFLANAMSGTGVSYQWYTNGFAVSGATNSVYVTPPLFNSNTYYCRVSCNGGTPVSSLPLQINMSNFLNCYCSSMAVSSADADIISFGFSGNTNSSPCTVAATGAGSMLNQYSNFTNLGTLASASIGTNVSFSIEVDDCDVPPVPYYSFGTAIWIDFNQNGSFADSGEKVFAGPTLLTGPSIISGTIHIPCIARPGITRLRVTAAEGLSGSAISPCHFYGFGETEDYLVNLTQPATTCSTPIPAPGNTISSISTFCDSATAVLSLSNNCLSQNYAYQWFRNNTLLPGATATTYTSPYLNATTSFYCRVSCGATSVNSGSVTITKQIMNITLTASSPSYCNPGGTPVTLTAGGGASYYWIPNNSLSSSGGNVVSASPAVSTIYTVTASNAAGCSKSSTVNISVINCSAPFTLKFFIQGYYLAGGQMINALQNQGVGSNTLLTDSVLIELHSAISPFALVSSQKVLLSTSGICNISFPPGTASYYIVIKQRNSLETWSALPVNASLGTYDFSLAANKAYGNNMILVDTGKWGIYSGEIVKDGNIDLLDLSVIEGAINLFASGYLDEDINGDGNVDLLDSAPPETNISTFVYTQSP